jgi:hypothetical protein
MGVVLSYILVGVLGIFVGFAFLFFVGKYRGYSGVIKVIPEEGRLIYSLELHEDPIMLQHMREVVFKVETSDESSDRK